MNVSDYVLERLVAWGVRRVFGYPGDGINGLMGAFNRRKQADLRFIQARHEETAAFMACGHAKFTGEVGVCLATSGPGAIHLLNGLYDAKMDHVPVVALVGQTARSALGGDYQQEVDLKSLFKDVAHEYVHTCMTPESIRHLVDRAFRTASAERTVTCVILPKDVQELEFEPPPHAHDTIHSAPGFSRPRVIPRTTDIERAAEILNAAERVAMLVGNGARDATEQVVAVAERLSAGVAKALLGRTVVPDDLPFVTGSIGLIGTEPSWKLMQECDALLMVGSSFPYSEFLPKEGKARGIQIDIDGRMLGIRYPMELNLVGDARETLELLLPHLRQKEHGEFRRNILQWNADWEKLSEQRASTQANPINPQLVFREGSKYLPDRCIISADSGSAAAWYARDLKLRSGMLASLSGSLATMGPAVPYAIAAKFAHPDRPAIAFVGDGAMQMNGNAELLTIARHWREWADPRLVVLVLHNNDLNFVTWEMRAMAGDARYEASQDLPEFPYAAYAELIGLRGIQVEQPNQVTDAWRQALQADRPVVMDVRVDPDVPPMPPHVTLKQAKAFAMSLQQEGSPGGVIKQVIQQVFPKKPT
ncbi:MAG TPA: thiamine pyrophosphate-requiring protein [Polyangiaceae bacterium]|nr:thiamine pyrophosphate-requiring protein [Polyangiaceae bacterium]